MQCGKCFPFNICPLSLVGATVTYEKQFLRSRKGGPVLTLNVDGVCIFPQLPYKCLFTLSYDMSHRLWPLAAHCPSASGLNGPVALPSRHGAGLSQRPLPSGAAACPLALSPSEQGYGPYRPFLSAARAVPPSPK